MVYKGSQLKLQVTHIQNLLNTNIGGSRRNQESDLSFICWRISASQVQNASLVFGKEKGLQESISRAIC
jgi:hypothetical protein